MLEATNLFSIAITRGQCVADCFPVAVAADIVARLLWIVVVVAVNIADLTLASSIFSTDSGGSSCSGIGCGCSVDALVF